MKPLHKFGDQIILDHEFYGKIEGKVQDFSLVRTGMWPFRKKKIVYNIWCIINWEGEDMETLFVAEEKYIKKKTTLRQVE